MHVYQSWLLVALVAALTACGEPASDNDDANPVAPAASSPATVAAPAVAAPSVGGYEPNDSERVPGITMSQEELDQIDKAARANMPTPVIPAE